MITPVKYCKFNVGFYHFKGFVMTNIQKKLVLADICHTSQNLNKLIRSKLISIEQVAKICEVKSGTVTRWRSSQDIKSKRSMSKDKWDKLIKSKKFNHIYFIYPPEFT